MLKPRWSYVLILSAIVGIVVWFIGKNYHPVVTKTVNFGEIKTLYTLGKKIEVGFAEFPVSTEISINHRYLSKITKGLINTGLGPFDNTHIKINPFYKLQYGWFWKDLEPLELQITEKGDNLSIVIDGVPFPYVLDKTKTYLSGEKSLEAFYEGWFVNEEALEMEKIKAYRQSDSLANEKLKLHLRQKQIETLKTSSQTLYNTLHSAYLLSGKNLESFEIIFTDDNQAYHTKITAAGFEMLSAKETSLQKTGTTKRM